MANITVKMMDGYSLQISCGNRKMKTGFGIFNLIEKQTCPGSTEFCRNHCYASKASRAYRGVTSRRVANLTASKQLDFVPSMLTAIRKLSKLKVFTGFFRIHEAGDFYSQSYVNSWIEITKAFPSIKFLAFTKSFHLDFSGMPSNIQMVYSVMPDTDMLKVPHIGIKAYAGDIKGIPANTLECPGLCDTCGACWGLSKAGVNVHFSIH